MRISEMYFPYCLPLIFFSPFRIKIIHGNHNLYDILTWITLIYSPQNEFWIYWSVSNSRIYYYIVLNKNWKIYWLEQSFTGVGPEVWCSSWGLILVSFYQHYWWGYILFVLTNNVNHVKIWSKLMACMNYFVNIQFLSLRKHSNHFFSVFLNMFIITVKYSWVYTNKNKVM